MRGPLFRDGMPAHAPAGEGGLHTSRRRAKQSRSVGPRHLLHGVFASPLYQNRSIPASCSSTPRHADSFGHMLDAIAGISRTIERRLVYCGAFLAFLSPYFLRSFSRESRVRRPASRRTCLFASSAFSRARAVAWIMAPAWPLTPPPMTLANTLKLVRRLVRRRGRVMAVWCEGRGKRTSSGMPLTMMLPLPGCSSTRAVLRLRRPTAVKLVRLERTPPVGAAGGRSRIVIRSAPD